MSDLLMNTVIAHERYNHDMICQCFTALSIFDIEMNIELTVVFYTCVRRSGERTDDLSMEAPKITNITFN
jgi:hypothetical protein